MSDLDSTPEWSVPTPPIPQAPANSPVAKNKSSRLNVITLIISIIALATALNNTSTADSTSTLGTTVATIAPENADDADLYKQPVDLEGFINQISKSVVYIECGEDAGSGFSYEPGDIELDPGFNSWVVTNHHVIEACVDGLNDVVVYTGGEKMLSSKADLWKYDYENDLAMIQISTPLPPLKDAPVYAEPGWWNMAIGNPGADYVSIVNATTFGNIIGVQSEYLNLTSAIVNPGNSGGPLVNSRGELIGINTRHKVNQEDGIWNIAFDSTILCENIISCKDYVPFDER